MDLEWGVVQNKLEWGKFFKVPTWKKENCRQHEYNIKTDSKETGCVE
jgi:hypothetical protein